MSERASDLSVVKLALLAREAREQGAASWLSSEPIAVVGVGCRMPGGIDDAESYWRFLCAGGDAVREVPRDRWDADALYDADGTKPGRLATRWGSFLDDVADFDAAFFGIAPREAAAMDPQQRILLEVAWHAVEDAGIRPEALAGSSTGVFVAAYQTDYGTMLQADPRLLDVYWLSGNSASIAANRLSFVLDLHGPSLAVDTGCSASLVTVHLACESLRRRECDLALAGGVNLMLSPLSTLPHSRGGVMARDGRCKTFDARADGFVRGEGCGVAVLKRLADALTDGDEIVAVVRGSAVNQDGRTTGLTTPNGLAQRDVLRAALAAAAVAPAQVSYVEAHGTGTALGDPIEVEALAAVYGRHRPLGTPCRVGSVKTNFGHLEAAAGIAGFLKAALVVRHRSVPPSLHFERWNPEIRLDGADLEVPTANTPLPDIGGRRLAAVSGFGFGGTNVHVLLEEPPEATVAAGAARREKAPRRVFDRRRHWLAPKAPAAVGAVDLPGTRLDLATGGTVFTASVDIERVPELADHRFRGKSILPMAAHVASLVSIARQLLGTAAVCVSELRLLWPVGLSAEPTSFQTIVRRSGERLEAEVFVMRGGAFERVATAALVAAPATEPRLAAVVDGGRTTAADVYRALESSGMSFGPAFRGLESVCARDGYAEAEVALATATAAVALDNVLQPLGVLLAAAARPGVAYLPVSVERATVLADLPRRFVVRASLAAADGVRVRGDVEALDESGRLVAALSGVELRAAAETAEGEPALLVPGWRAHTPAACVLPGPVLLLAEGTGVATAAAAAARLRERGVDASVADDWVRPAGSVVDLRPLTDTRSAVDQAARGVALLTGAARGQVVAIVTEGAAGRPGSEAACASAALHGLFLSAAAERPGQRLLRFDLEPEDVVDVERRGRRLADALLDAGEERAFWLREDGVHVPDLPVAMPPAPAARELGPAAVAFDAPIVVVREGAVYLVTGGLGALGLETAEWLAAEGATCLVLVGRSGPSEEAERRLGALRARGVRIEVRAADVSREEEVRAVIDEAAALGVLGGVFHAAGVVEDALLDDVGPDQLRRVFAAKLDGALHLHRATLDRPLDFFVLYSSAASVLGSAGQTAYGAANAGLDALARYRHRRGLAALAVSWGAFDVGMAAGLGEAQRRRVRARGVRTMTPAAAFEALGRALRLGVPHVAIVALDAERRAASAASLAAPAAWWERLARIPAGQRGAALRRELQEEVGRVLGLAAGEVPLQRGFQELGMDSLTSVEIRNRLQAVTRGSLPTTIAFDHPNVEALAAFLERELLASEGAPKPEGGARGADAPDLAAVLDELDALSEAESLGQLRPGETRR